MARIAFYAPMKSPHHPVPSGDRRMARLLLRALSEPAKPEQAVHDTTLVSTFQSRDGRGDPAHQSALIEQAEAEIARIRTGLPPDLWVTYHNYYKAPDLIGPALCAYWNIPYVLIEATRARKRLSGPWARFAGAAEAANDAAQVIFYLTEHDGAALHSQRAPGQTLAPLRPFLDAQTLAPVPDRAPGTDLFTAAMMRAGDKMASYRRLADMLRHVQTPGWTLSIAGDGPERAAVQALFAPFKDQVRLLGQLNAVQMQQAYRAADLFVWPGLNEAYGMVYLEAQAAGLPALAEDRPGVRDVLPSSSLTQRDDPKAMAARVDRLLADPTQWHRARQSAHALVQDRHLFPSAQAQILETLAPLLLPTAPNKG